MVLVSTTTRHCTTRWNRARWHQGAKPDAAGFNVCLTSITWREAWKYGERAFRYCQHDVGHALAALRFAAAALGWRVQLLPEWDDARLARLLGLNRVEDFADAEQETPGALGEDVRKRGCESLKFWKPGFREFGTKVMNGKV